MKNALKRFEANQQGRDFVIGDLHGSYSCFENLLKNINFDPDIDRMFSVGDLVDRGPDSHRCLSLIYEPWFHAVISNHEQMMIEKFRGGYMGRFWYQNGGDWAVEAVNDYQSRHERVPSDQSRAVYDSVDVLEELPYLITVENKSGNKFHIVHAELPFRFEGRPLTDCDLAVEENVRDLATVQTQDGDYFLWSRYHFGIFYKKKPESIPEILEQMKRHKALPDYCPDLSPVISGHTILRQPITFANRTNIDTGAYLSYFKPAVPYGGAAILPEEWAGLTCIELDTWKFYQATENNFKEIEPYTV